MVPSDAELVQGTLSGKEECLQELLGRYLRPVYAWIRHKGFIRPEAEDLTQETLIRAGQKLAQFDSEKAKFRTWLFEVANNMCHMQLRRQARHPAPVSIEDLTQEPSCAGPEELLARSTSEAMLWQAVCRLPLKLRAVVVMFFYWNMNRSEVARLLGLCEGTVRYRLRSASRLMRKQLAAQGVTSAAQMAL